MSTKVLYLFFTALSLINSGIICCDRPDEEQIRIGPVSWWASKCYDIIEGASSLDDIQSQGWWDKSKKYRTRKIKGKHFGENKSEAAWGGVLEYGDCLVIGFHGTRSIGDWFVNLQMGLFQNNNNIFVHSGFQQVREDITYGLYRAIKEIMKARHPEIIKKYKEEVSEIEDKSKHAAIFLHSVAEKYQIIFTGHSLGGAIAQLAYKDMIGILQIPDLLEKSECITFCAPRVGNQKWISEFGMNQPKNYIHDLDLIPYLPPHLACVKNVSIPYIPSNLIKLSSLITAGLLVSTIFIENRNFHCAARISGLVLLALLGLDAHKIPTAVRNARTAVPGWL